MDFGQSLRSTSRFAKIMKMTVYRSIAKPRLLVPIMHSQAEVDLLMKVVNELKPSVFVELGNWCGGLTLMLHQKFPDMEIYSFDLYSIAGNLYELFGDNVTFVIQDVLKSNSLIKRLLNSGGRKFLYCDNGNKAAEVNLYAKHLREGDGLGIHDYSDRVQERIGETVRGFASYDCSPYRVSNRFWIKR